MPLARLLCLILVAGLLVRCSTSSGPAVVSVDSEAVQIYSATKEPRKIPWDQIQGMSVAGHLVSEGGESALVLRVLLESGPVEVCSHYDRRVDPKSYGGMYSRQSVSSADFEAVREAIIAGAGLKPVAEADGHWEGGGERGEVSAASFAHSFD